jgi:PAS domain S-box-containing protein
MITSTKSVSRAELLSEMESLRARLEEAEETLRAIRSGEVDALVVEGPEGEQVFTLKGAEHGYRVLVETMTEGAVTFSAEGIIFYCNARFAAMLNMPLEKIIGLPIQHFVLPSQVSAFATLMSKEDRNRRGEFVLMTSDSAPLPVLVSMSVLPEANVATICAVITDLSEQKHAATLENMVVERTAQLREKIGELEAFSYSISHDMRQPLRTMQGYAHILLEDYGEKFDHEPKIFLQRIETAAQRLDRLIQDVLTYSRTAREGDQLSTMNLDEIVRDVVEGYPSLRNAKIEIDPSMTLVRGYEVALTQSISNLLANAVKFVPPGRIPEIRIRAEQRDNFIRLWIIDNGIGIAAQDQQRIFEIFSRVHSNEVYEGTGIGLSIVKKSVEKMGGRVGVESELGKGSRFWIELQKAA